MNKVTRILECSTGEAKAAEELLPLVYDELRRLATNKLATLWAYCMFMIR